MRSLQSIESTLYSHKDRLFAKYPIKSMAIFGPYAREEQIEESDLDLMVELNGQIGIRFIDLAEEIEQLIGFKVDLVARKGIKDKYFQSIQSDLLYV